MMIVGPVCDLSPDSILRCDATCSLQLHSAERPLCSVIEIDTTHNISSQCTIKMNLNPLR